MVQDYNEWLAINVLSEQQYVSYRQLSRALRVHGNTSKQMLYDFWRSQNSKRPGTVHATFLITGSRQRQHSATQVNGVHHDEDGDINMQSSQPFPSSSMPGQDEEMQDQSRVTKCIVLVKEEHLEQARNTFASISSIHLYSLEPKALSAVQVLTECNRIVATDYASEDPLDSWKQYGVIQNPNVKRRTRRNVPPLPAPPAPGIKASAALAAKAGPKDGVVGSKADSTKPSAAKGTPEISKPGLTKPASLQRQSSSLFKSFAKGAAKSKKLDSQDSIAPTDSADERMGGFSDDEEDEGTVDAVPLDHDSGVKDHSGKSKTEREAELQAMMELDDKDDEMNEDVPATEQEPEIAIDAADQVKEQEQKVEDDAAKESVVVSDGRRRGRRRVMKKKTVKDEEGYLVTKEEAAWESFSEDEPPPKKIKSLPAASTRDAINNKGKKGAVGGKQSGNIMSFFTKR